MRILYVSPSGALGGAERVLLTLLGGLRRSQPDWRLGLIALEHGPLIDRARALGCDARAIPAPARLLALGEHGRSSGATLADAARAVLPVRRYVREVGSAVEAWRPDLVHANGLKAHVLSAMVAAGDRPLVWHMHDYVGRRRVSAALLRWFERRASCVVAVSGSVADDVRATLGRKAAVRTIHNGIDAGRFGDRAEPLDLDALAGLPPAPAGTTRVGLVATYARWKGHATFLRAIAAMPASLPVRAYVIGGPVYATRQSQYSRDELQAHVHEAGLDGRVGLVPFEPDVARAYRALDIVVHASTEPEPFGLVVVEAMCCGRAVVASAAGGTCELVDPGKTGLQHRPGDAEDLASQIERLVRDPDLRRRLAAAARTQALQRFAADAMTTAMVGLYGDLVAPSAAARVGAGEPLWTC